MKQHITLKQWDEITKEQKNILWDSGFKRDWKMNIIQMIEFLDEIEWNMIFTVSGRTAIPLQKHFCDILWQAVKYKLNNK